MLSCHAVSLQKKKLKGGLRALDKKHISFIRYMNDFGVNNALMRIILPDGSSMLKSVVINRWYDNVNSLFLEETRLDPTKDTIGIVDGSVGSYPNMFIVVDSEELGRFFDIVENFDGSASMQEDVLRFFISRGDERFWEHYDLFQERLNEDEPVQAGLYDLNRYYKTPF